MKIKSFFVAVLLIGGALVPPANASELPAVESFTFSPQEIDLSGNSTEVTFELVVSHPYGIENNFTMLTLKNSRNDSLGTTLTRVDSNLNSSKVTFKGSVSVPRNFNPGVYTLSAAGVRNNRTISLRYH